MNIGNKLNINSNLPSFYGNFDVTLIRKYCVNGIFYYVFKSKDDTHTLTIRDFTINNAPLEDVQKQE